MQLYTSISEYWNNSNAAFPTFVPQRLSIYIYIQRHSDDCQEHDILYGSEVLFHHRKVKGQTRTVCSNRRRLKAVRNSSPFVKYQAGANRCLQLRSVTEIPHNPRLPHLFLPPRVLCLYPMAWKAAVISIQRTSTEDGTYSIGFSTNSSFPAASDCDWWENCARENERIEFRWRLHFDIYFWTFRSESCALQRDGVSLNHEIKKGRWKL